MPPLTLDITAEFDPALHGPTEARELGAEIARRRNCHLAATITGPDTSRITWSFLATDPGQPPEVLLLDLVRLTQHLGALEGDEDSGYTTSVDIRVVAMECATSAEIARRLAQPSIPDLIGTGDFADLLGISRQRLHQLQAAEPVTEFPQPLARGVYLRAAADRYAASRLARFPKEQPVITDADMHMQVETAVNAGGPSSPQASTSTPSSAS